MNRRDFLTKGALAVAGAVAAGSVLAAAIEKAPAPSGRKRVGLQLYSLREAMKKDPAGTLKAIAAMGYLDLQTANYDNGLIYGYEPAKFRTLVEGLGMKVTSCHIKKDWDPAKEAEIMAWWDKALDDNAAAGCTTVVMPAFPIGKTLPEIKAYCDYFNRIGELAAKKGLRFGFHNHAKEFVKIDGVVIYDYMLKNTDPKKVFFEMDVYWVQEGGYDPVAYLKKYKGRFPQLHVKDVSTIGASGKLDFKAIFEAAYKQGTTAYYVEVEKYTEGTPEQCVEKSFDYLYKADFVK